MKKISIARYSEFKAYAALHSRFARDIRYIGKNHENKHAYRVYYSNTGFTYYIIVYW